MTTSEQTFAEICAAFERIIGRPLDAYETKRVHPMQEEADARRIERRQDDLRWAGYATAREMDGAAEDAWYGRADS